MLLLWSISLLHSDRTCRAERDCNLLRDCLCLLVWPWESFESLFLLCFFPYRRAHCTHSRDIMYIVMCVVQSPNTLFIQRNIIKNITSRRSKRQKISFVWVCLCVVQFRTWNLFRFKHWKDLWPKNKEQKLMNTVFSEWIAALFILWTDQMEVSRVCLYSVSICVFVFCWKPAGALSYILYSERELKPFKLETEYWQYVNRTEENIFLRERRALKESKWIDHTRLSVLLSPLRIL